VATGTLAAKLVRQATKWNGHEAFILLRNGYVFHEPQTATILLAQLSKIRLLRDEDASAFCLRLVELIEDLELIPGAAAVFLTDTQKIGYLLSAIRHETGLQAVYSQLLSEQLRGTTTFERACEELHHRVETMKADEFMDGHSGRALVSTEGKKNGQQGIPAAKLLCLAKDCLEMIQAYLPLCKLCYLQSMAGKIPILELRDGLSNAVFSTATKKLDFPAGVPRSRFPQKGLKKGRKVLMAGPMIVAPAGGAVSSHPSIEGQTVAIVPATVPDHNILTNDICGAVGLSVLGVVSDPADSGIPARSDWVTGCSSLGTTPIGEEIVLSGSEVVGSVCVFSRTNLRCLLSRGPDVVILYVDSGAGQSLSSCSTAFVEMLPCQVEITGIAGALQIYGCGTALFLADDSDGRSVILRVHNCLYGQGKFNLLSVSQVCQMDGNSVDFTLASPALVVRSTSARKRSIRLPLVLEDGLFAISVTPFQVDDPRHKSLPNFDVTPSGVFVCNTLVKIRKWGTPGKYFS
jgi:hypothetical protein